MTQFSFENFYEKSHYDFRFLKRYKRFVKLMVYKRREQTIGFLMQRKIAF